MKIVILISSALINQETGQTAGLAETVECDDERGEFLVSIGAAREADEPDSEPEPEEDDDDKKDVAPSKPAPAKAAPAAKPVAKPAK